jgi:flagellar hook-basal body complex protein FliE
MAIERIGPGPLRGPTEFDPLKRRAQLVDEPGGDSFAKALGDAITEVSALSHEADARVEAFVRGEDVALHEVVLAQEEAEIGFRLLLEVRDQLVRAYQEITRIPM